MLWLIFSLLCALCWGLTDLFDKIGSTRSDPYCYMKKLIWVGIVMGGMAFILLPFSESGLPLHRLIAANVRFLPVPLFCVLALAFFCTGLRYMELSIVSPIANSTGSFAVILMLSYYLATGNIKSLWEAIFPSDLLGMALITGGVIALGAVQQKLSLKETLRSPAQRKYRFGALALLFPLLYGLFDALATGCTGLMLDSNAGVSTLGEKDFMILYGVTSAAVSIVLYFVLWKLTGKPYHPFCKSELARVGAAVMEYVANFFYVYAMADNPLFAAPIVSAYCIISIVLSRAFLKEKLNLQQYACVAAVIAGIVILGLSDLLRIAIAW